jgi:virulence factor MgtC-like protein
VTSLKSEDIEGSNRVRVLAEMGPTGRSERLIERIVSGLRMEPGTSAVSWPTVNQEPAGTWVVGVLLG